MNRTTVPKRLRYEVLRRDGFACTVCNRKGGELGDATLEVDHIVPEALGGATTAENLVTLCDDCNAGKASIAPDQTQLDAASTRHQQARRALAQVLADDLEQHADLAEQVRAFDRAWSDWTVDGRPLDREDAWQVTVRRFLEHPALVYDDLARAIDIAAAANHIPAEARWRYFCGVVNNQIRDRVDRAAGVIARGGTTTADTTPAPTEPDEPEPQHGRDPFTYLDYVTQQQLPDANQILRLAGTVYGGGRPLDELELVKLLLQQHGLEPDSWAIEPLEAVLRRAPLGEDLALSSQPEIYPDLHLTMWERLPYNADGTIHAATRRWMQELTGLDDTADDERLADSAVHEAGLALQPIYQLFTDPVPPERWDPTATTSKNPARLHPATCDALGVARAPSPDAVVIRAAHLAGLPLPHTRDGYSVLRNAVEVIDAAACDHSDVTLTRVRNPRAAIALLADFRQLGVEAPSDPAQVVTDAAAATQAQVAKAVWDVVRHPDSAPPACDGSNCPPEPELPF